MNKVCVGAEPVALDLVKFFKLLGIYPRSFKMIPEFANLLDFDISKTILKDHLEFCKNDSSITNFIDSSFKHLPLEKYRNIGKTPSRDFSLFLKFKIKEEFEKVIEIILKKINEDAIIIYFDRDWHVPYMFVGATFIGFCLCFDK